MKFYEVFDRPRLRAQLAADPRWQQLLDTRGLGELLVFRLMVRFGTFDAMVTTSDGALLSVLGVGNYRGRLVRAACGWRTDARSTHAVASNGAHVDS